MVTQGGAPGGSERTCGVVVEVVVVETDMTVGGEEGPERKGGTEGWSLTS